MGGSLSQGPASPVLARSGVGRDLSEEGPCGSSASPSPTALVEREGRKRSKALRKEIRVRDVHHGFISESDSGSERGGERPGLSSRRWASLAPVLVINARGPPWDSVLFSVQMLCPIGSTVQFGYPSCLSSLLTVIKKKNLTLDF